MVETDKKSADYILPLYINGLSGRMLRMRPPKSSKKEILFIYGSHASLERYYGVADYLNQFGGVTMPDLPGFGGMDAFYKIGEKPTLDNMADYLASFIKLRYRNKRLILAGYSLGVVIYTRMLQKHPEITKKVDLVVSAGGFVHKEDFKFKRRNYWLMRGAASLLTGRIGSSLIRHVILSGPAIRIGYRIVERNHPKLVDANKQERKKRIDFEVRLWQCNEVRTYMETVLTMLKLDLTRSYIDIPIYHVGMDNDWYFDNVRVEQHMRTIYKDFYFFKAKALAHSPSIVATAKDAAPFFPPALRRVLRRTGN